mmetsp:Transcript_84908/g.263755  ORF Transcript_84908/g.263755 Transcript_84908/m.263755 type:complete len:239 (-) Transcript_84908:184-900(-)
MDIEGQATAAERALQELQQAVQATSSKGKQAEPPLQNISNCERLAQRTKNALESYRLELRSLSREEQVLHGNRLRSLEEGLKQCRTQVEWKRLDAESAAGSGGGAAGSSGEAGDGPMSLEQAVAVAEQTQDQSKASVARSMRMVLEAEQVGVATLGKMHEQEEQMTRISEDVEDIKANLKRSKKLLGQIARSAASDRCIQILCVLLTIAILAMVTVAITGNDNGELNVPDPVRQVGSG